MGNSSSIPTSGTSARKGSSQAAVATGATSNLANSSSSSSTAASPSSSPQDVLAPKCPISGQEAKNGETCAYDPTKMSFWTSKAVTTKTKTVILEESPPESCPMRAKSNTSSIEGANQTNSFVKVASDKYKNPNQYNVISMRNANGSTPTSLRCKPLSVISYRRTQASPILSFSEGLQSKD